MLGQKDWSRERKLRVSNTTVTTNQLCTLVKQTRQAEEEENKEWNDTRNVKTATNQEQNIKETNEVVWTPDEDGVEQNSQEGE